MMLYVSYCILFFSTTSYCKITEDVYKSTWESLDSRPTPKWFDEAKVGIFIHWGIYSVPSYGGEWFWEHWIDRNYTSLETFMEKNYPPGFSYQEFAKEFTAEFFNPKDWATLFKNSGAKYVVLTTKHHEGYTLWPSTYSFGWNSKDVGPKRDLVGDLAEAVRAENMEFGVYYSLYEWYNPLYHHDKNNNFTTQLYVHNKMFPEMQEVVEKYKPAVVWTDGDWETYDTYWESTQFLAWLYNNSSVKNKVVVNDRWGIGTYCKHGDFYSCQDRYNPGVLQTHKWENAMTIDRYSWGYRRDIEIRQILPIDELISILAQTISCGGNILINIGPTKEGTIIPIFQERLYQLGFWLYINGEAIYKSKPWKSQNDTLTSGIWYTVDDTSNVFVIVLQWPEKNVLRLKSVFSLFSADSTTISLLGNDGKLEWKISEDFVSIQFPDKATVISQWAWVLRITKNE